MVEVRLKTKPVYIFDYYSKGVPEPLGITLKENPQ